MNKKCQVFTPAQNVKELLDAVEYKTDIYGKTVIENACGDGNILEEIVRRYIQDALRQKKSVDEIRQGLQNNIYGVEIDDGHYKNCINKLTAVADSFDIMDVKWNILNEDFLKKKAGIKFDFVIGNPPYITYRDLDINTRKYLKENFNSCRQGKFDYCYAFIEASLSCLNDKGKLAYLIPSSIFKNVFAQELRDIILPDVVRIIDYTTQKLFEDALTSSAILVCEKGVDSQEIEYYDVANCRNYKIKKTNLVGKWVFVEHKMEKNTKRRFGDYFTAAISIATLLNKAYILKDFSHEEDFIKINDFRIERDLIREGVSPRSLNYGKKELILFPYSYDGDTLIRYEPNEFSKKFPEATKYLESYTEKLRKRKADKSTSWFEYGRTQALAHLNQPKLLLSTVVTKEVKVYKLDKECIPYSGIYIVPRNNLPLSKAKEILESKDFYEYVKGIGINASGSSLRITAKDIENFEFK